MKRKYYLIFIFVFGILASCRSQVKHADPFYDLNSGMDPRRIPLIKPIETVLLPSTGSWYLTFHPGIYVEDPIGQEPYYFYSNLFGFEKFAVSSGIVLVYSSYVDEKADTFIQENYYHWFVIFPEDDQTKGFHTEDEFTEYIQKLGIEDPVWQTPDEAYKQFKRTGCLEWIPDCN
jgi:hypothetical protein